MRLSLWNTRYAIPRGESRLYCYAFAKEPALKPHWVNTGGHDLFKRLFFGKEADVKEQISTLMLGESFYAHIDRAT